MAKNKMELKQKIDRADFMQMLHQLLDAFESNRQSTMMVDGQECVLPGDVLDRCKIEVEFEREHDEYEFEITLKWKDTQHTGSEMEGAH